jgi:ferrous iron transport protein B
MKKGFEYKCLSPWEMAVKLLLKEEKELFGEIKEHPFYLELQPILLECLDNLYSYHETKNLKDINSFENNAIAKGIKTETVNCSRQITKTLTQTIDSILINRFLGIPIFLFFMWSLFQLTFELGSIPMDWIDQAFTVFGQEVGKFISNDTLHGVIVDGIIPGVGAVLMFLPNIVILFIGIALLETTGYMSRVAFLLDGFFHRFGLHGKSFIPLVTGFGCSVPAYMATRTLKSEKDRLITLFIIGFMSCGAKLPVYVLFVGAFFDESQAGNILFLIYIAGALLGLMMAKVLRVVVFKGEDEPFVMEMPKYRLPSLKLIWFTVFGKAKSYVKKAGTFILAASILIWFASNYPKQPLLEDEYKAKIELVQGEQKKQDLQNELELKLLENSYLGVIGKATVPLFEPLGFDWRLTVALETGLAAKEVIVATLGILYGAGSDVDEESGSLLQTLKSSIPLATALSFLAFSIIYLPCLAASLVFAKEAGGFKYLFYLFVFTTTTAWVVSFIVYNIFS